MNKADLKEKWGSFCDTNKLVDDTMALLTKYNHRNSEHGVCKLLDAFFENKRNLIILLASSQHYAGDMRVVLDVELARENSRDDVHRFCYSFMSNVGARKLIVKNTDEHGKKQADYLKIGIERLSPRDLLDENIVQLLSASGENVHKFNNNGELVESVCVYSDLDNFFAYKINQNWQGSLINEVVKSAAALPTPVKLTEGMKISRAFNKVCAAYGIDKLPKYNKLFAEYADMVSSLTRHMKFFISVNPLDYLTMSFGVNWASCHTIDKRNIRNMPNAYSGAYCGGTLSYMLDPTSIVTYVHSSMPESFEEGKVYRNMFHYENGLLIQGRIYPQGNDGATDLYKTFRGFVQDELSELLDLESTTWVKKSGSASDYVSSSGVHYRDYASFSSCNASYPKEMKDIANTSVRVGHSGICPYCGEEFSSSDKLSHYDHCPTNNQ